jgi:hypothetical protein
MVGGAFRFILAILAFIIMGIVVNPMLSSLFNGFTLPSLGVFLASLAAAGLVIGSK